MIVGAGPAGLAAAIRLKQLAAEKDQDLNVVVLEKGAEVGAHILSGLVMDPIGLDKLIPDWRDQDCPLTTKVSDDKFYYLSSESGSFGIPTLLNPPLMNNHHCYTGSLGALCKWLGEQAEALGVEVYPGIAVTGAIYGDDGEVKGVITGDMGIGRDGEKKDSYTPGIALTGKYTLLAEGARGSLSKEVISRFELNHESGPQKYGIGLKELWEIPAEKHKPGLVQHTMGWPLDDHTGGGTFLYHFGDNLVSVGFVMHLTTPTPICIPSRNSSGPRHIPPSKSIWRGASASPTAPAR
ncbi:Electron transfer flavoprotein-ubiquinone oxidoreductase [Methyloligella halotolerans]|uniref:Electron transfer flavoprotein-ubiquinone oxidoreductase n=1 Tax=Methyloligella halotolerans TaxID=1177755 RepID=A0A1E2RYZ1_9HYPH|nr:Electron transfer flavoprotein-ubiquinone oxidoreductase [Methyloligella halotolerans]